MLIEVSTPTSAAELRALYRRTGAYFAAAKPRAADTSPAAATPGVVTGPSRRTRLLPAAGSQPRFSGRATVRVVARHFRLTPEALAGAARLRRIVVARWIVMRICIDVGGYTAMRAGRLLGRDHTTVLYGLHELDALLARDAILTAEVERLAQRCARGAPSSAGQGGA
jgi:uncharacterized small protein (DUF1192 family)